MPCSTLPGTYTPHGPGHGTAPFAGAAGYTGRPTPFGQQCQKAATLGVTAFQCLLGAAAA